jgi:6-phosphogluconolactonase/glucosamine-6-phosphate isomerase/deaminase
MKGIKIIKVKNSKEGFEVCKKLLYKIVSKDTVLFLSGGSTPKGLYEILAKEQKLTVGAVAMVDERYFSKFKIQNSKLPEGTNELMIEQAGLIRYLQKAGVRFFTVINNKNIEETTKDYDETAHFLFNHFKKSVAILGIGADGHTAGIPARSQNSKFKIQNSKTDLVTFFTDFPAGQKERITLTFSGLSKFDQIIVLAFGEEKKKALKQMFEDARLQTPERSDGGQGSIAQIPARFLVQELSDKVVLITDQSV